MPRNLRKKKLVSYKGKDAGDDDDNDDEFAFFVRPSKKQASADETSYEDLSFKHKPQTEKEDAFDKLFASAPIDSPSRSFSPVDSSSSDPFSSKSLIEDEDDDTIGLFTSLGNEGEEEKKKKPKRKTRQSRPPPPRNQVFSEETFNFKPVYEKRGKAGGGRAASEATLPKATDTNTSNLLFSSVLDGMAMENKNDDGSLVGVMQHDGSKASRGSGARSDTNDFFEKTCDSDRIQDGNALPSAASGSQSMEQDKTNSSSVSNAKTGVKDFFEKTHDSEHMHSKESPVASTKKGNMSMKKDKSNSSTGVSDPDLFKDNDFDDPRAQNRDVTRPSVSDSLLPQNGQVRAEHGSSTVHLHSSSMEHPEVQKGDPPHSSTVQDSDASPKVGVSCANLSFLDNLQMNMVTSTPVTFMIPARSDIAVNRRKTENIQKFSLTDMPEEHDFFEDSVFAQSGKKWRRTIFKVRSSQKSDAHNIRVPSRPSIVVEKLWNDSQQQEEQKQHVSILETPDVSVTDKVLAECTVKKVVPFGDLYDEEILRAAKKVGEGSYGEVFLLPDFYYKRLQGQEGLDKGAPPVLKVVPVDGSIPVNGSQQTRLLDMMAEMAVSRELSKISKASQAVNFVQILDCYLIEGLYPSALLDLWDAYEEERGSDNDRPDGVLLPGDQRFVALVFSNGGKDLEAFSKDLGDSQLTNASKGVAVFMQVAHALAVAEDLLQFEHRDLHWGNVLIRETEERFFNYRLRDSDAVFSVASERIRATLIDFTLSRCRVHDDSAGVGEVVFTDLSQDQELFLAEGVQHGGDYQFDVYRMMRDQVGDSWQSFHSRTNVFWLHYLLDKLINRISYKMVKSKIHRQAMARLRRLQSTIMDYKSCKEFVLSEGNRTD